MDLQPLDDLPMVQKKTVTIPLQYKSLKNYSNITNILLVHNQVKNYTDFVYYCNPIL